MASRNQGIQMLLQAEKEANDKVSAAKKRKANKLKQAKEEAISEINAEKAAKEAEFKALEDKIMGKRTDIQQKINITTEQTIKQLETNVQKNKNVAIDMLLNLVFDIKPILHRNYRNISVGG